MRYPHIKLIESADTALSAKEIKKNKTAGIGAIASDIAARMYNLEIVAPSIETNKRNFTRFWIVENKNAFQLLNNKNDINKSSLCFSLPHEQEVFKSAYNLVVL